MGHHCIAQPQTILGLKDKWDLFWKREPTVDLKPQKLIGNLDKNHIEKKKKNLMACF